jgi:hypothetical protein
VFDLRRMAAKAMGLGHQVKQDSLLEVDGWKRSERLFKGLELPEWRCDFYLSTGLTAGVMHVAVNIDVTGEKAQRRGGDLMRRVRVTFVGDGEPDQVVGGWVSEWSLED